MSFFKDWSSRPGASQAELDALWIEYIGRKKPKSLDEQEQKDQDEEKEGTFR